MKSITLFFLALGISCFFEANAQENFTGLVDPALAINVETDSIWSFEFSAGNREVVYQNGNFDVEAKFLELNAFANYALDNTQGFSLGVRYRFKTVFDSEAMDEKRFIQQYEHVKRSGSVRFKERLRIEERFREINSLRTRYRFGAIFPLNRTEKPLKKLFLTLQTETLWMVGVNEKPSFDQRVSTGLSKLISANTAVKAGVQYRLEDYTHQPGHELFLFLGFSIDL